jgi:hypothetical protein
MNVDSKFLEEIGKRIARDTAGIAAIFIADLVFLFFLAYISPLVDPCYLRLTFLVSQAMATGLLIKLSNLNLIKLLNRHSLEIYRTELNRPRRPTEKPTAESPKEKFYPENSSQ